MLNAAFAGIHERIKASAEDPAGARQKMLDEKLLAAPKIDVNDNSGGTTALFLAELNKFEDVAAALRAAGAHGLVAVR